jgi:hypothetical protein
VCPHIEKFRKAFIAERTRQWQIRKQLNDLIMQITYLKNQNPACAGQYANDFIPKKILCHILYYQSEES